MAQYALGQTVAHVHQIHAKKFGLTMADSWVTFYIKQRMDPLITTPIQIIK
ncbi:MAG: Hypothetical protein AJITA_00781 [Acetilactobacillus jinshanensis]